MELEDEASKGGKVDCHTVMLYKEPMMYKYRMPSLGGQGGWGEMCRLLLVERSLDTGSFVT